ncbi:Methyltransferase-like protein 17, mitochondrial [Rhizophlyctis rosea]|nr:Methyltransferase-like protein 17, mitochondrial [Rhizophlyctis rosea]
MLTKTPMPPTPTESRNAANDEAEKEEEEAEEEGEEKGLSGRLRRLTPEARFGTNRIGMVIIPDALQHATHTVAAGQKAKWMRPGKDRIFKSLKSQGFLSKHSEHLKKNPATSTLTPTQSRQNHLEPHNITYGPAESLAYLTTRLPVTYAALHTILTELRKRAPDFAPTRMLDYGTGPGTAIWAANETFPSLEKSVGVDISESMLDIAERMLGFERSPVGEDERRGVELWRVLPGGTMEGEEKPGLVVAAYALSELASDAVREEVVRKLWGLTGDMLILIERGTPIGFGQIAAARQLILAEEFEKSQQQGEQGKGVHIVAPCPHEATCPMTRSRGSSWCHFNQRVQTTKRMREVKQSKAGDEDHKYSYVVLRRGKRPVPTSLSSDLVTTSYTWPRINVPPLKRKGHVVIDACTPRGNMERAVVTQRAYGKGVWRDGRKCHWGDLWPHVGVRSEVRDFYRGKEGDGDGELDEHWRVAREDEEVEKGKREKDVWRRGRHLRKDV